MKIAVLRHSIRNRGSDRIVRDYTAALAEKDHALRYYTNVHRSSYIHSSSVEISKIPLPYKLGTVLFAVFNKFKEDVIVVDLVAMACLTAIRNRKKIIYFAQDYDEAYYAFVLMKWFIRFCYWWALKILKIPVISESDGLSGQLARFSPVFLKTVPNGVGFGDFIRDNNSPYLNKREGEVVIVYFVRNEHRKGVDIASQALETLAKKQVSKTWEVWTVGDFLPAIDGIKMTQWGFLQSEELKGVLSAADIYFMSARSEGLSTLLLQAMACGCAVVGTEACWVLRHGQDGLISPVGDACALAANLVMLIEDNKLRWQLQAAASSRAYDFDLKKSQQDFVLAVEEILMGLAGSPSEGNRPDQAS